MIDIPMEVRPEEDGTRLDVFLHRRMPRLSRSLAARLVRLGRVRRDPGDVLTRPSTKVAVGERIVMKRRELGEASPDDVELPVLFQDDVILAVNKPGDLVVHPTATAYHRTLVRIVRSRWNSEDWDLAHRIDKETSGVVVLACEREVAQDLHLQFARREVEKSYLAIVVGDPAWEALEVKAPLRWIPQSVSKVLMEVGGDDALPALTQLRVLSRGQNVALVEARPKTGRQHQIRVHLQWAGHPIIGDKLYLGNEELFFRAVNGSLSGEALVGELGHYRQALHAFRNTFRHPRSGEPMTIEAPLPGDLRRLASRFKIPLVSLDQGI